MNTTIVMCFILVAAIAKLAYSAVYNYFLHPLANVPGPLSGRVFPFWTTGVLFKQRLNPKLAELHFIYGSVVRIGPNELSFTSLEAHDVIYRIPHTKSRDGHYFSKDGTLQDTLTKLLFNAPTIGTVSDRILHRRLRNRMAPAFTVKATFAQQAIQDQHLAKLMTEIDHASAQQTTFDLTSLIATMLWDLVSELSFGEPLVAGKKDVFVNLQKQYQQMFPVFEILNYAFPWLEKLVVHGAKYLPSSTAQAFLPTGRLRQCMERQDGRQDFLTAIMGDREKNQEIQLDWQDLYSNASFFIVSGYFTNEISHSALFYQLLKNPKIMHRLQDEIRSTFRSISDIKAKGCIGLPYLNACIQESLRLLPPLAGKFMSRQSPGAVIDGIWVPFGTQVYCEVYTMGRSPHYWVEPDKFIPERFLQREPGSRYEHDVMEAFKPFSSGPRTCIGRELALQSLRLSVAKLVWKYDLSLETGFDWERDCNSSALWSRYRLLVKARCMQRE